MIKKKMKNNTTPIKNLSKEDKLKIKELDKKKQEILERSKKSETPVPNTRSDAKIINFREICERTTPTFRALTKKRDQIVSYLREHNIVHAEEPYKDVLHTFNLICRTWQHDIPLYEKDEITKDLLLMYEQRDTLMEQHNSAMAKLAYKFVDTAHHQMVTGETVTDQLPKQVLEKQKSIKKYEVKSLTEKEYLERYPVKVSVNKKRARSPSKGKEENQVIENQAPMDKEIKFDSRN